MLGIIIARPASAGHEAKHAEHQGALPLAAGPLVNSQENGRQTAPMALVGSSSSPAAAPSPRIRGRLLLDAQRVSGDNGYSDSDFAMARSARLGVSGRMLHRGDYKFVIDFAGSSVSVEDAFLAFEYSVGELKVGHFKSANSLEEITSLRHTTFLERAAFTDAFELDRHWGVGYRLTGSHWSFEAGAFALAAPGDASGDVLGAGRVLAARVTYGGQARGTTWMVGASVRHRDAGEEALLAYSQPAHLRLSETFLETGPVAKEDFFVGLEGGLQAGAFYVASEWAGLRAKRHGADGPDPDFHGYYVEAGWFLTGEAKPLSPADGVWKRPQIRRPVASGGPGAWQLAARFDRLDLTADGIYGGEQNTYVLGVNWYVNERIRFSANYSHSAIRDAFDAPANGPNGANAVDAFGFRFQTDW